MNPLPPLSLMSFSIVIVEDEPLTRRAIIKALLKSGLQLTEIHQADNGEKGLQILEQNNIDIALVDLNLHGMNGDEMVRRARQNPDLRRLPIVFISGDKNKDRIKNIQYQGLIEKPFTPERLGEAIVKMIS